MPLCVRLSPPKEQRANTLFVKQLMVVHLHRVQNGDKIKSQNILLLIVLLFILLVGCLPCSVFRPLGGH
jgi:hypothetical protein